MKLKNAFNFVHISECESTQEVALKFACKKNQATLVLADTQTKGRGRRGREWLSTADNSLLMTLAIPEKNVSTFANLFSLYAGAVLYVTLLKESDKFSKLTLKWPNDLGVYEKETFHKTAGLLVEVKKGFFLLGVGINLKGIAPYDGALSLSEVNPNIYIDRESFAKSYAHNLIEELQSPTTKNNLLEFISNKAMKKLWNKSLGSKWQGHVAKGLSGDGALISQALTGKVEVIYSGDI